MQRRKCSVTADVTGEFVQEMRQAAHISGPMEETCRHLKTTLAQLSFIDDDHWVRRWACDSSKTAATWRQTRHWCPHLRVVREGVPRDDALSDGVGDARDRRGVRAVQIHALRAVQVQ